MNRNDLVEKLIFLSDENVEKFLTVFVTTPNNRPKRFCINTDDIDELKDDFISFCKGKLIDDEDYKIEDYSTSTSRGGTYYRFDLGSCNYLPEMSNLTTIIGQDHPDEFIAEGDSLEKINGLYVLLKDRNAEHIITMYRPVYQVDKTYSRSTFLFGWCHDNDMFARERRSFLRISPVMHMLQVDGEIIFLEMTKLEKALKLDALIQKETASDIASIMTKSIVLSSDTLLEACRKPSLCKKLRHALAHSKVMQVENTKIIEFALNQKKLKFKFNSDKTQFDLKSKSSAIRFIKLLDDDYLHSVLTDEDYDAEHKNGLQEAVEQG